jgi:flagellar motor switch protein FliN/FliY
MNKLHATSVHALELAELSSRPEPAGPPLLEGQLALLHGVKVMLSASLGCARMTVAELFALKDGSLLRLDRLVDEPVDIMLDDKVIARGQLVAIEDSFGISITQAPQTPSAPQAAPTTPSPRP